MKKQTVKPVIYLLIAAVVVAIVAATVMRSRKPGVRAKDILAAYQKQAKYTPLTILYPFDDTLFPPEIVVAQKGHFKLHAFVASISKNKGKFST